MPAPVSSASALLAARLVSCEPSAMRSRSSAAPSGVRLRTAPSTSTVEMNFSVSSGSSSPVTRGMAIQVAVSSSARSGSPDAIPAHRLDITRSTMASASVGPLPAAAWPAGTVSVRTRPAGALLAGALLAGTLLAGTLSAGALLAGALLAGLPRRGLVFLLTASSYGPKPTKLGVQGVDEVLEGDVHRFRQPEPARALQRGDAVTGGPPHAHGVDEGGTLQVVARQGRADHLDRLHRGLDILLVARRGRQHAARVAPRIGQ